MLRRADLAAYGKDTPVVTHPAAAAGDPCNPFEAFRAVVYAAGVEKLAGRMGVPAGTLYNKANLHDESHHKPTLRDVVLVSQLTHDHRVLHALAHTLGEVCFAVPDLSGVSDTALLEAVTRIGIEGGEFHAALARGLDDGQFTRREYQRLRLEALEWMGAIAEAVARVEGLVHE